MLKPRGYTLLHRLSTGFTHLCRRPVRLPHRSIHPTHRPTAPILLRLVPVNVPHADPVAAPHAASAGAHRPLGVILRGFKGDPLPRRDQIHVQNFPAGRAVGGQDAGRATPELHQQVRPESRCHPGVVEVWVRWHRETQRFKCETMNYKCITITDLLLLL